MATAVSFGNLTFATATVHSDIMDIYKKNVSKLKNSGENLAPVQVVETPAEDSKLYSENKKFGALTGINEDYYRPAEKVISKIEDAINEDKKPAFQYYC